MRTFSAFASPNAEVSPERAILLSQVSLPQNELNREKRDVADAALANSAESAYQRLCSASRVFSRAFLLALIVNDPLSVARLHAQSSQPAIEFINVTAAAGIKFVHFKGNNGISINREEFGPGVCVADFDGDGWQDIYFVNGRDVYNRGISARNALYRNNGDGTFTDVTEKAGVPGTGYGLGCVWGDYDNDGFPDLFVTQYGRNVLYHNNGNGTFSDVTDRAGVAGTESGAFHSGATFFDYDRDGRLDLYISDFQRSSDHLWHNDGKEFFDEVSDQAGITRPTRDVLSFGGGFFDYDNDGWLDLFIANGHVYPEVEQATPEIHYKQINSLFHNEGNGKFVETTKLAGSGFQTPHVGRGVAFADFENDGFVDVVVANNGDPPLLLHNSGGNGNHFLNFKLVGTKSNRDAMGGRIRIVVGGLSQIREVAGGGSYLSQSDLRANFGLGKATRVESVEITWPSGQRQVFHNVEADKFYLIEEGKDQLQMQKFAGNSRANAHILSGSMSS